MELKEFISKSIKDVVDAMIESQDYIQKQGYGEGLDDGYKRLNFDIAVTSQDESKTGGSGKISVASVFSVKGEKENNQATTNYSRIQFSTLVAIDTKRNSR